MKYSELSRRYAGLLGGATIAALAVLVIGCGGGGGSSVTSGADAGSVAGSVSGSDAGSVSGSDSGSVSGSDSGSVSGSDAGSTAGVLPQNVVFYVQSPTGSIQETRYITPAASGDSLYASLDANLFEGIALNPANAGQRFFGHRATSDGQVGIYKNATVNFSGAVQVVAPMFKHIVSLQMSNDGNTIYIVGYETDLSPTKLYKVAATGGAPVALDNAEDAHLNAAGTMLVYSKLGSSFTTDIWKRGVNTADVPVRLTNSDGEDEFVQWSKDSTKVVFSSDRSGTMRIYTMAADGTNVHQVTSTGETLDLSPTFNSDGSKIAYLAISSDAVGSPSNLSIIDSAGTDQNKVSLKAAQDFILGTYWTGTNGRSIGVTSLLGQRYRLRHHR